MSESNFRGSIFDLDGVITDTAKTHALAWERMFNSFLKKRACQSNKPFIPFDRYKDYLNYVDGKPRLEGIQCFFDSRSIKLPFGNLSDHPEQETICGLGNQKNLDFRNILKANGPDVFLSSVSFIKKLLEHNIKVGVASSSRNCKLILELANLDHLFETIVDGDYAIQYKLKGKPAPDIFITAAANLGLCPSECMVVEDAISGVQAAEAGGFGLVLGIAREQNIEALSKNGADIVKNDLAEITLREIKTWKTFNTTAKNYRDYNLKKG